MVQINFAKKEINCKIVFYGPGMSGKTTNLEKVHENAPKDVIGNLTSIATEGDRTLFFDFMPLDLGNVAGMRTKLQLYTVPGQVYYSSTRKLVLQGVDGVVFVADSQKHKMPENIESLEDLEKNLGEYNITLDKCPFVIQWNKQDLPELASVEELESTLNKHNVPTFPAVAINGVGVMETLKAISKLVLDKLNKEYGGKGKGAVRPAKPVAAATSSDSKPQPVATPAAQKPEPSSDSTSKAEPAVVPKTKPDPVPAQKAEPSSVQKTPQASPTKATSPQPEVKKAKPVSPSTTPKPKAVHSSPQPISVKPKKAKSNTTMIVVIVIIVILAVIAGVLFLT